MLSLFYGDSSIFQRRVIWSDMNFVNLKVSGSNLEDDLELEETGYRKNSQVGARNKEMGV